MIEWFKKLFKIKPPEPYWTCICGHEIYFHYDTHGLGYKLTSYFVEDHKAKCSRYIVANTPIYDPSKVLRRQIYRRR